MRLPAFSTIADSKCSGGITTFTFNASSSTFTRSRPSFAYTLLYATTLRPFTSRYSISPTDSLSSTVPAIGFPALELSASFWHVLQYEPSVILAFWHCVNSPQLYASPKHPVSFSSDSMNGSLIEHFTSFGAFAFFSGTSFASFFPELRFFISFTPTRKFSKSKFNSASVASKPYSTLQRRTHSRAYSFVAFSSVFNSSEVTDTDILLC